VDEADPVKVVISEPEGDDDHVLISITDRGLGVPSDHFSHIFDWFWSSAGKPLM
jgi:signal transduction histidine kinase